jgi:DNA-binding transcriptional regulator YbjK
LAAVLRAAVARVIVDKGLGAFSTREVARLAGVSTPPGHTSASIEDTAERFS